VTSRQRGGDVSKVGSSAVLLAVLVATIAWDTRRAKQAGVA
jgi:hypothetical protein